MSDSRQLQLIVARDLSQRLRSTLDLAAVAAIVMLLVAAAARVYTDFVARSELTEAFSLVSSVKVDMATYHAQYGEWPRTDILLANAAVEDIYPLGRFTESIEAYPDGTIVVLLDGEDIAPAIQGRQLVFEPVPTVAEFDDVLRWRCRTLSAGHTEPGLLVDPAYLPLACKER